MFSCDFDPIMSLLHGVHRTFMCEIKGPGLTTSLNTPKSHARNPAYILHINIFPGIRPTKFNLISSSLTTVDSQRKQVKLKRVAGSSSNSATYDSWTLGRPLGVTIYIGTAQGECWVSFKLSQWTKHIYFFLVWFSRESKSYIYTILHSEHITLAYEITMCRL